MYKYLKSKNECLDLFVESGRQSIFFKNKGVETNSEDSDLTHFKTHHEYLATQKKKINNKHFGSRRSLYNQYISYMDDNIFPLYYNTPNVRVHNIEIRHRNFINSDLEKTTIKSIFRFFWNEFFDPMDFGDSSFIPSKGFLIEVLFGNDQEKISLITKPNKRQEFLDTCSWSMDELKIINDEEVMKEAKWDVNDCNKNIPYVKNSSLFREGNFFNSIRFEILNDMLYDTNSEMESINRTRDTFVTAFSQVPFKTHEDILGWCNYFFMMGSNDSEKYDNVIKLINYINEEDSLNRLNAIAMNKFNFDMENYDKLGVNFEDLKYKE
jgi:hypothetical protein